MRGMVRWVEGQTMEGITEGGKKFGIYGEEYPSPMEMLLHAHAACSFVDVIGGLKERMKNVNAAWIEIEGERRVESPRVFTNIHMKYVIKGNVAEELVRRIIEYSHEKLCSVGIMMTGYGVKLTWDLKIDKI
jgi:putative redox protein|tara:strand:+ start:18040 stop:18435 length:396 start_codon:yes stop_codon:yes gene_type:complete